MHLLLGLEYTRLSKALAYTVAFKNLQKPEHHESLIVLTVTRTWPLSFIAS